MYGVVEEWFHTTKMQKCGTFENEPVNCSSACGRCGVSVDQWWKSSLNTMAGVMVCW